MSNGRRAGAWVGWLVAGLLVLAAGGYVLVFKVSADHLDTADKVASVISAVAAVAGLVAAVYGVVLARRGASGGPPGDGGPVQQNVRAGRDAYVAGRDQHFGRGPAGS